MSAQLRDRPKWADNAIFEAELQMRSRLEAGAALMRLIVQASTVNAQAMLEEHILRLKLRLLQKPRRLRRRRRLHPRRLRLPRSVKRSATVSRAFMRRRCWPWASARRGGQAHQTQGGLQGAQLGGRAHAQLDEPLPPHPDSLGEEGLKLPRPASLLLRLDYLQMRRYFRIGSKSPAGEKVAASISSPSFHAPYSNGTIQSEIEPSTFIRLPSSV